MSENIHQIFIANPITSNAPGDLMYFGQSPYGVGDDAAMSYANFALQFGAPYTPAALTKIDDTNVTLTLGGTPATALLHSTSLTLGWSGQLSPARGGTGVNNGSNTLTLAGSLSTVGAFSSNLTMTGATNVTFPTSGTLATTSQLVTPSALTKTDDTNVTLTLGGSPSTALVNAASMTLGWNGVLSGTRGGTGLAGTGLITAPVDSQVSSLTLGAAYQNVLGYDIVLTVYLDLVSATTADVLLGVGSTNTPTQQTIISSFTTVTETIVPVTIYIPNNYYALLSTSGTISVSITGQQALPV